MEGNNRLDPLVEQGLMKILKILDNNQDIDRIISEINREYSDEGCLSRIIIFADTQEIECKSVPSNIEIHNKKDLFLFKQSNLYFVLKHDQTIKLVDDENVNLKLRMNRIIDELNRSEATYRKIIEDLEKKRANILDQLNNELRQLSDNMMTNERVIRKLQCQIEELNNNLKDENKDIDRTETELMITRKEKLKLANEKVNLEVEKKKILIDKTTHEEDNLKEKQAEIDRNQAWIKFIENLNEAFLSETILQCKQKTSDEIKSIKILEELYQKLIGNSILNQFLFKDLNIQDVDEYVRRARSLREDENYNLFIKLKQTANSFLCPINGQLISELGLDADGKPIQVKKYKISANCSISYRATRQNLKDNIEREIKCQAGGLIFEQDYLKVKDSGVNSLDDLPMEIKPLIIDRIKINYQQHEWSNRLNSKYEKAVELLNQLKINYRDIVYFYIDQIEIQCRGTFLLDSNDYYPGVDLIIRARKMKCGKQGESVCLITSGSDAPEFVLSRASDGYQRRRHKNTPEGHSGFDGEFGRDGRHAGNIFIKIDETIEDLELLKSIELCGGKGGVGQLGGNGDKGCRGKDGENGVADDTRTKSGDGGNAGFSGCGGRAGKAGKLSISDTQGNLYELLKDRIRQDDGLPGKDPDLLSSSSPKGGEGGDPTIIGMDQIRNKRSCFHRTKIENGEVDIQHSLEKNPELRKEIEKSQKCGNRGLPEYVSVPFFLLAPLPLAPLPLLIDRTISYRKTKNEEQYKVNPRRDKNTKGKSKQNETSRFRQDTTRKKQNDLTEYIGKNHYEQRINKLKLDKQNIDNKLESYWSQLHSVEININIKGQHIQTLQSQINQCQNELTRLRQEKEQHEHEHEINWLLDKNTDIPRIRKIDMVKVEQNAFTPFRQKSFYKNRNEKENDEERVWFHFHAFLIFLIEYFVNDDRSIEIIVCWLIKFDCKNIPYSDIIKAVHEFSPESKNPLLDTLIEFESEHELVTIGEFNPYCLLKQSLKTVIVTLKHITETNLKDIRFNLNQIERYYRGIQNSYNIEIQKLNQIIESIKIESDHLKDVESNKLFIDFIREIELITIEKTLDKLDKHKRIYLLKIFKLILNYLISSTEEYIFSYLDSNFLAELSKLKEEFGTCNNSLLTRIETDLNNIREKKFLEESNTINDIEQIIALFDARRLFRLECASIDFHHSNVCLTPLESDMLQFNKHPNFPQLISLVKVFQTELIKKENSFYGKLTETDRKFFKIVTDNFDYFDPYSIESEMLDDFCNIRIKNKIRLNPLMDSLKKKTLSPQYYHNIVNKLLSSYADFDDKKKHSIEEQVNQIEHNSNIQVVYREFCRLTSRQESYVRYNSSIITNQTDDELNEAAEDARFVEKIKESWAGFNIKKVTIETTLMQVFYELNSTHIDKTLRDRAKNDYKKQIEFILSQVTSDGSREKVYFMFLALGQHNYQCEDHDSETINRIYQTEVDDEEQRTKVWGWGWGGCTSFIMTPTPTPKDY
ncbi:unnamed protein product [Rotaria magnacalcarata]|uniref:Uncharacterized protein n=1 Tax=Rotaria magnacalcarata TaxID=392030 RepID=A0A819VXV4_9BILA|nr:unnamed protein product [Rotaria magnacalcarata]